MDVLGNSIGIGDERQQAEMLAAIMYAFATASKHAYPIPRDHYLPEKWKSRPVALGDRTARGPAVSRPGSR